MNRALLAISLSLSVISSAAVIYLLADRPAPDLRERETAAEDPRIDELTRRLDRAMATIS